MPKVRLIVASRQVMVDTFSNAASAISILDSLTLASVPTVFPGLMVLVVLEKQDGDAETVMTNIAVRLNERELGTSPGSISFTGQRMARVIADLGNLVVDAPGELRFSLETKDAILGEYVVAIELAAPNLFNQQAGIGSPVVD